MMLNCVSPTVPGASPANWTCAAAVPIVALEEPFRYASGFDGDVTAFDTARSRGRIRQVHGNLAAHLGRISTGC